MSDTLQPCPFPNAGRDGVAHDLTIAGDGKGSVWVECMECWAHGPLAKERSQAVAAWNRRPSAEALVEALRKELAEANDIHR